VHPNWLETGGKDQNSMRCDGLLLLVWVLSIAYLSVVISSEEGDASLKHIQLHHRSLRKKGRRHNKDTEMIVKDATEDKEDAIAVGGQIDEPEQDANPKEGGRKKRMKQHSQPHSKEVMKYTRLKNKISKNADKFTAEEISSINQDMDKYLELVNTLPDFQGSIKKEHEQHRGMKDKEARKAKFDEIKMKYQLEREKYKGTIEAGKNLFKVIRKKIEKKISTEEEQ